MKQNFDCIIVGAGIAGMSAAIYLKRANKNVLLIEKYIPGGQINKTANVENYPGFIKIDGPSLVMNVNDQITNLNIPLVYEEVIDLKKEKTFVIKTNKNLYETSNVILATGRNSKKLGIENEEKYLGRGISYCALCDGNLFKNKEVVVIGGGNSALEESIYLSNICKKVTIINRSSKLRADKILHKRIEKLKNIEVIYDCIVNKINSDKDYIKSISTNKGEINCEGIFIYIGLVPELTFLNKINLKLNDDYIVVDKNMKTNIEGLYACGDIIKKDIYQIITAASEGAIAATNVIKNIK